MSIRDAIIVTIVTYFLTQTLAVTFKKWESMTLVNRVYSLETLVVTLMGFCICCDILLDNRFESFNKSNIRGELFGFRGGLINKYAHHAYFRGRGYLKELKRTDDKVGEDGGEERGEKRELKVNQNGGETKSKISNIQRTINEREKGEDRSSLGEKTDMLEDRSPLGRPQWIEEGNSKISDNNLHQGIDKHKTDLSFLFSEAGSGNENDFNLYRTLNHEDETYENDSSNTSKIRNIEENSRTTFIFKSSSRPTSSGDQLSSKNSLQFETGDEEQGFHDDFIEKFDENSDLMVEIDGKSCRPSMKTRKIIGKHSEKCTKRIKLSIFMFASICTFMNIVPLCKILFHLFRGTKMTDFKTTFLTYFPFTKSSSPENIQQFTIVVILEYVYLFLYYQLGLDNFTLILLGYSMTHTELGLLTESLKEFDHQYLHEKIVFSDKNSDEQRQRIICKKFNHLAAHHQAILSKVRKMSQMISFRVLYINGALCFELCIAIFLIVEGDYSLKIKYVMIATCLVGMSALISEDGQLIEDGLADLRDSFYELRWHNLPKELQKSLLIVLTRSTRPPQIGSMGVFYINRLNFSAIIQASYSYFNLLTRFKK